MTSYCPKDGTACCDDLCHGSGCVQMGGYTMLTRCDMCGGIIDEELGEYCECLDLDDDEDLEIPDFLVGSGRAQPKTCRLCGCTDDDCEQCIKRTGQPCYWVKDDLCSACVVTDRQREILRHALGLNYASTPYRDTFNAEPGTRDCEDCEALVEQGLMTKLVPIDWIPGLVFRVTDPGRLIALEDHANA